MKNKKRGASRSSWHLQCAIFRIQGFAKRLLSRDYVVGIFFLSHLIVGSIILDDYGVSMDEPIQRKHGIVSLEYVNGKLGHLLPFENLYDEDLETYDHRDYGVVFQMGAYFIERSLGLSDTRDIFLLRHALVFLLFWLSAIFFYRILEHHLHDWRMALLGTAFLILSPRIFADSFYNPKDIPLLSWCIISIYTLLKLLDLKNLKYGLLHGFACAMIINTRIVGVYIPVLTIFFLALDWIKTSGRKEPLKGYLKSYSLFVISCIALTILFWPYLWSDPLSHFYYSFKAMSNFRWFNGIFFMGDFVFPNKLPWYYIPVWIGVSTPIFYLLLFIIGVGIIFASLFTNRFLIYSSDEERNALIFLCFFLAPLIAVVLLKSTLYNGWRHLYFVYPSMLLVSTHGLKSIFDWLRSAFSKSHAQLILKTTLISTIVICTFYVGYRTVIMHPFQNVYFNSIVASKAGEYFDMDYYGVSFKQGIERLLKNAPDPVVKVAFSNFSGMNNIYILPGYLRERIVETDLESANFYITNYQLNLQSRDRILRRSFPYDQHVLDTIEVDKSNIIGIYILNH